MYRFLLIHFAGAFVVLNADDVVEAINLCDWKANEIATVTKIGQ